MKTLLLSFVSLIATAHLLCASQSIALENQEGNALIATPILLDGDDFVFKRNDGETFTIKLSTLNQASQDRVERFFRKKIDTPSNPIAYKYVQPQPDQVIKSKDGHYILKTTYTDQSKDHTRIHHYPEMDLVEIALERTDENGLQFTLTFLENLPNTLISDAPYRIWIMLNLDGNDDTGQQQQASLRGADMAIAVNGFSTEAEWTSYNVSKSEVGNLSDLKVSNIVCSQNSVSFVINGAHMNQDETFKLGLSTCAMGGRTVDRFPDQGWLTVSHKTGKR